MHTSPAESGTQPHSRKCVTRLLLVLQDPALLHHLLVSPTLLPNLTGLSTPWNPVEPFQKGPTQLNMCLLFSVQDPALLSHPLMSPTLLPNLTGLSTPWNPVETITHTTQHVPAVFPAGSRIALAPADVPNAAAQPDRAQHTTNPC
jgi:hypothetical protein